MQVHVLIADWSVAHFVVIVNDVMNDNMAAFAHVSEISVRIRVRLRVALF